MVRFHLSKHHIQKKIMPQLDFLLFPSQSFFLFFFFIGYVVFLKYILPILVFELKMKEKIELYYLTWLDNNYELPLQTRKSEPYFKLLLFYVRFMKSFHKFFQINKFHLVTVTNLDLKRCRGIYYQKKKIRSR